MLGNIPKSANVLNAELNYTLLLQDFGAIGRIELRSKHVSYIPLMR